MFIFAIPDPPPDSSIRIQRIEDAVILYGMGPENESPVNRTGLRFMKGYLGVWRGCVTVQMIVGSLFILVTGFLMIGDKMRIARLAAVIGAALLFLMIWIATHLFMLQKTKLAAENAKLLANEKDLPQWRIELRLDKMSVFRLGQSPQYELDPNSIRDVRVNERREVIVTGFDNKSEKSVDVQLTNSLSDSDACWLRQVLG